MILKVIREEENEKTKEKQIKTEYYSGKRITTEQKNETTEVENLDITATVDNEDIMLFTYSALDFADNLVKSSVLNAYIMNEDGKTIERII